MGGKSEKSVLKIEPLRYMGPKELWIVPPSKRKKGLGRT